MKRPGRLRRGGPMARSKSLQSASRLKRKPMPRSFRESVFELSDGLCALCGRQLPDDDWAAHHRLLRSQGGKDTHANVIPLCHPDHALVHVDRGPEWSYAHGFLVPRKHGDPESWPVFRRLTRWQQPTDTGWISAAPHAHQVELGETA